MTLDFHYSQLHRKPIKKNKRLKIIKRANNFCEMEGCNNLVDDSMEIHHILPVHLGGTNEMNNLVLLCPECHKKISQLHQCNENWIVQHEELLRQNPNLDYWRKQRIIKVMEDLKREILNHYKFEKH